jgi:hypothetical protein
MTTTEAQRLRSMKARFTRLYGAGDPDTLTVGRKLMLEHLGRWLRAARVQDWSEHEFAVLLRMIEFARTLPPRGEIPLAGKRCPGQAPAVPLPKIVPGQEHDAVSLAAKKNVLGVKKNGPAALPVAPS